MSTRVISPLSRHIDLALLVLRVVVGIVFVAHGAQKIFVYGFPGVTAAFGQMGIPMPGITGPLTAIVELLAGLALIFGLLTRLAALGLAIDMLGAIVLVHLQNGFFILPPRVGYEYAFTLLGACAALALSDAGAYSLDAVIANRRAPARNS